ncbi:hypothetical protein ACEPAF_2626 [Sanghuangporus sanghuang]
MLSETRCCRKPLSTVFRRGFWVGVLRTRRTTSSPNIQCKPRSCQPWPDGIRSRVCIRSSTLTFERDLPEFETAGLKCPPSGVISVSAWVNNLPIILIFRFFAGIFAGCPINNGSGVISDLYSSNPRKLQKTIGLYAFTALSGPVIGSLTGFFIAAHLTDGFWVLRVHWIMTIALWPLVFFFPETHGPTILTKRARKERKEGNASAVSAHELRHSSMKEIVQRNIGRPFAMLLIEPIVMGAAVWVALSYSIVYFFFEAFPIVFVEQNHFQFQLGGLPFIGITLGMIICVATTDKLTRMSRHVKLPFIDPPGVGTPADAPEAGLKVVLIACILTPVSLFWFAWTSRGDVHWISPALAGVPFGYSMLGTFYSFNAYSTQIFSIYASSASASNTLFRSVVASIFPIIAHPILSGLGTAWGISLFGFLSLGLLPIPLIFIRYGPALRERSHFAREARRIMAEMRHSNDDDYDDKGLQTIRTPDTEMAEKDATKKTRDEVTATRSSNCFYGRYELGYS